MKRVRAVEFQKNYVLIRYTDGEDPEWVTGRELAVDWTRQGKAERLAHVGYRVFLFFLEHPEAVAANEEVLQEWLGKLLSEEPGGGHTVP